MIFVKDRVKQGTATAGLGTITFGSSFGGYQDFSVLNDGSQTFYAIEELTNWEVGIGTYSSNTLSRDTILDSASGVGLPIYLSGNATVFITYPATGAVFTTGTIASLTGISLGVSGVAFNDGTTQGTAFSYASGASIDTNSANLISTGNDLFTGLYNVSGKITDHTTYTAGTGLTLVGNEFNTTGTGHFDQITFSSGNLIKIGEESASGILKSALVTAIGYRAGYQAFEADYSNLLGDLAGAETSGCLHGNMIGFYAGRYASGSPYTNAIGYQAGREINNCDKTNMVGYYAGYQASGADESNLLGYGAGVGSFNVSNSNLIGKNAGRQASGEKNNYIGYQAGYLATGINNTEIVTDGANPSIIGDNDNKINIQGTIIGDTELKLLAIGDVGASNLTPDATLELLPSGANNIGLKVQGAIGQAANLTEWHTGTLAVAKVDETGAISGQHFEFGDGTIQTTALVAGSFTSASGLRIDNNSSRISTIESTGVALTGSVLGLALSGVALYTGLYNASGNLRADLATTGAFNHSEIIVVSGLLGGMSAASGLRIDNNTSNLATTGAFNHSEILTVSGLVGGSYTAGTGLALVGNEFNTTGTGYFDELGIGTTSPSYILDIQDHSNPVTLRLRAGDTNDSLVRFDQESTNQAAIGYDHSSSLFKLNNHSSFGTNNHLVIDTDGNVGINTDSPNYTLDVGGDIGVREFIYHSGDNDTYLRFAPNLVNLVAGGWSAIKLDKSTDKIVLNNTNRDLDVQIMDSGAEVYFHADAGSGFIGIGGFTAEEGERPAYTLDVSGTGNFSSGVRFPDGEVQKIAFGSQSGNALFTGLYNASGNLRADLATTGAFNHSEIIVVSGLLGGMSPASGLRIDNNTLNLATTGAFNHSEILTVSGLVGGSYTAGTGLNLVGTRFDTSGTGYFDQLTFANNAVRIGFQTDFAEGEALYPIYIGYQAGRFSTGNSVNTIIGYNAGVYSSGLDNVSVIGQYAGRYAQDAENSIMIGTEAGHASTGVDHSTLIGRMAGKESTGVYYSNLIGHQAGMNSSGGTYVTAIGIGAGRDSYGAGSTPIMIGYVAGADGSGLLTASNLIGSHAGTDRRGPSTKSNMMGYSAGQYVSGCDDANWFGTEAGKEASGVHNATFIGEYAGKKSNSSSYINGIGYNAAGPITDSTYVDAIGYAAGAGASGFTSVLMLGNQVGFSAIGCAQSNMIGRNAGQYASGFTYGNMIGYDAGFRSTGCDRTTFIGHSAGAYTTNVDRGVMIGLSAGWGASEMSYATVIGHNAGYQASGNNNLYLGTNAGRLASGLNNIEILAPAGSNPSIIGENSNKINIQYTIMGDSDDKKIAIGEIGSDQIDSELDATLELHLASAGDIGLMIQTTDAGHYENLTEWRNSISMAVAKVDETGAISGSHFQFLDGTIQTTAAESFSSASGLRIDNNTLNLATTGAFNHSEILTVSGLVGGSYTAGTGLTLVGTEFNTTGTGHFDQITFTNEVIRLGENLADGEREATGTYPIAIGYNAGQNTTGTYSTFIGHGAGFEADDMSSRYSIAIGRVAGHQMKDSENSIIIGEQAATPMSGVPESVIIGHQAANSAYDQSYANMIGWHAGQQSSGCDGTTMIGVSAGSYGKKSFYSNFIGALAGHNASGNYNQYFGYYAGKIASGTNNIEIVTQGPSVSTIGNNSNKINIEKTIIGDTNLKLLAIGDVGTGNLTPEATIEILPSDANDIGLKVQGAVSQAANLTEWHTGVLPVAKVDETGAISGQHLEFGDGTTQTTAATSFNYPHYANLRQANSQSVSNLAWAQILMDTTEDIYGATTGTHGIKIERSGLYQINCQLGMETTRGDEQHFVSVWTGALADTISADAVIGYTASTINTTDENMYGSHCMQWNLPSGTYVYAGVWFDDYRSLPATDSTTAQSAADRRDPKLQIHEVI